MDWGILRFQGYRIHTSRSARYSQANHPMISHAFCCKSEGCIVVSTITSTPKWSINVNLVTHVFLLGNYAFQVIIGSRIMTIFCAYNASIITRTCYHRGNLKLHHPCFSRFPLNSHALSKWPYRTRVLTLRRTVNRCCRVLSSLHVSCIRMHQRGNMSLLEPIRNISETLWGRFTQRILVCAYKDRNFQEMYEYINGYRHRPDVFPIMISTQFHRCESVDGFFESAGESWVIAFHKIPRSCRSSKSWRSNRTSYSKRLNLRGLYLQGLVMDRGFRMIHKLRWLR